VARAVCAVLVGRCLWLERSDDLNAALLDEVRPARRAESQDDVHLRAGVPGRSVAHAERKVVAAVRGERLERLRDGLPALRTVQKPDLVRAHPLRRVAL